MRVAALCVEPELRPQTKAMVDRALALERELWSGEPAPAAEDGPTAAETAVAIEDLARAILRDAACGHLGSDLRSTADEILLADGLAVGEGKAEQRGGVEEWDLPPTELHELDYEEDDVEEAQPELEPPPDQLWLDVSDDWQEGREARDDRAPLQVPEPAGRIRIESRPQPEEDNVFRRSQISHDERRTTGERHASAIDAGEPGEDRVAQLLEERPRARQQVADRVAYLFPRPETTEWDVRELSYDRRRRAQPHTELRASRAG
jgi:hypothetical protein